MAGHGPDAETFERASSAELKPVYLAKTLAFMSETQLVVRSTEYAMNARILQHEYFESWQGLKRRFATETKYGRRRSKGGSACRGGRPARGHAPRI